MEDLTNNSSVEDSIQLSRNEPAALIVGVAGFLGSNLASNFLQKGIQVIGVDDFEFGRKSRVEKLEEFPNFHFLSPEQLTVLENISRLDYVFFTVHTKKEALSLAIKNYLNLLDKLKLSHTKKQQIKYCLVSSLSVYESKEDPELKNTELTFAKFMKEEGLNGRIVRLAPIFGRGMSTHFNDPLFSLLHLFIHNSQDHHPDFLHFTTRAFFIDDALHLIEKATLKGGTNGKIYEGSLIHPYKLTDIKNLLHLEDWQQKHHLLNPLDPWLTPNLERTIKELDWKPTTHYLAGLYKTYQYLLNQKPEVKVIEKKLNSDQVFEQLINQPKEEVIEEKPVEVEEDDVQVEVREKEGSSFNLKKGLIIISIAMISFLLIYPFIIFLTLPKIIEWQNREVINTKNIQQWKLIGGVYTELNYPLTFFSLIEEIISLPMGIKDYQILYESLKIGQEGTELKLECSGENNYQLVSQKLSLAAAVVEDYSDKSLWFGVYNPTLKSIASEYRALQSTACQ